TLVGAVVATAVTVAVLTPPEVATPHAVTTVAVSDALPARPNAMSISILEKLRTIGVIIILGNPANTSTGATSGGGESTTPPAQEQPAKETNPPAEQKPPEDQEQTPQRDQEE